MHGTSVSLLVESLHVQRLKHDGALECCKVQEGADAIDKKRAHRTSKALRF